MIYTYAAVHQERDNDYRFGVSYQSVFDQGFEDSNQLETYRFLDDALDSE